MVLEGVQWLARQATYRHPDATYWREAAAPLANLLTHAWESALAAPTHRLLKPLKYCRKHWLRGSIPWDYP